MSFLTLTFAICIGVFAGTLLYSGSGGMFQWFQGRPLMLKPWPFVVSLLAGLLVLGLFALWVVLEEPRTIKGAKTIKPISLDLEPLKIIPHPELMPPKALPPPPVARVIYIDGRKGYIRSFSVLWEGGEAFEDVDLRELPFASQLVPLPPRLHTKRR